MANDFLEIASQAACLNIHYITYRNKKKKKKKSNIWWIMAYSFFHFQWYRNNPGRPFYTQWDSSPGAPILGGGWPSLPPHCPCPGRTWASLSETVIVPWGRSLHFGRCWGNGEGTGQGSVPPLAGWKLSQAPLGPSGHLSTSSRGRQGPLHAPSRGWLWGFPA